MGNKQTKKIIILDERKTSEGSNYASLLNNQSKIQPVIYQTWSEFTQKEAIQDITDIIVRYDVKDKKTNSNKAPLDKQKNENDFSPREQQRKNSSKQIEDNIDIFVSNEYGPQNEQKKTFADVCPLLDISHLGTLKDVLISHVKKYSIKINIYLFVDKAQNIKLMHYQKPYIKLISDNLEEIIKSMRYSQQQVQSEAKSNRMFEGLYRRMVVKVLDEYYEQKQKANQQKKNDFKAKKKEQKNTLKDLIKKLESQSSIKNVEKNKLQQQRLRMEQEQRIFEKYKIQPQFFNNIDLFQKSFISTTCEYVICSEANLLNIMDCRLKCDQQYRIIVKEDKKQYEEGHRKNQSLNVWFRHHSLDEILKKILSYTQITHEEAPVLSSNIIICGNDPVFNTFAFKDDNQNQMKQKIKQFLIKSKDELIKQLNQNFESRFVSDYYQEKARRIEQKFQLQNKEKIQCFQIIDKLYKYQSNEATNKIIDKIKQIDKQEHKGKIDKLEYQIKLVKNCYITLVKGNHLQLNLLPQLKKSLYSYLVVFTQDDFLEEVKKFLRKNNFHQRVQLTSVMQTQKYDYNKMNQKDKLKIYKQKVQYLVSKKVPYLIKFQVGPIVSIHLYKPSRTLLNYFNDKIGLKAYQIKNIQEFKENYMHPNYNKIIESKRLVCNVDHYCNQIKPVIKQVRKLGLKIIIFDEDRAKIMQLTKQKSNFEPEIQYVDHQKLRIQNFVLLCKSPTVSIPFFRTSVLTDYIRQSKQIQKYKSSYSLSLESSVFSSNETIKEILGGNYLGLNTQYSTGFTIFSRANYECQRQIKKFEQNYLKSYVKLWYYGYGIIKSQVQIIMKHILAQNNSPRKNNVQQIEEVEVVTYSTELSLLKEQICYLFYKCKSYDLLSVSEDDFKQFYIQRIQQCNDFLDLQIACIYILSLPHGFNNVISDLFKNPRISKIAIKIFVVYIVVLLSAYYDYRNQQEETIKILTYLNNQNKLNKQIKNLKEGDTVFTNDFVFCIDTKKENINIEQQQSHHIIFKFDSIRVLEKSKIKSYINIQKYSFYKEGPEYVIPPFTKFMVTRVCSHDNQIYEVELRDITDREKSFPYQILNQNNLSQTLLFNTFKSEKSEKKAIAPYVDKVSMYKRTQTANIIRNKEDLLQQFKKSKNYNLFFQAKILQQYMTCHMYMIKERKELMIQLQKALNSEQINKQKVLLKNYGIEKAYLLYHFQQYALCIDVLRRIKQIMDDEGQINQRQQWKRAKTEKIMSAVESTFDKRSYEIMNHPKKKFWKVQLKKTKVQKEQKIKEQKIQKYPEFLLKGRSEEWENSFDEKLEIFPLTYINCAYEKDKQNPEMQVQNEKYNLLKKDLQDKDLVPSDMPNQFGSPAITEINLKLFEYLNQYTKQKTTEVIVQDQYTGQEDERYVEQQNVGDPFEKLLSFKTNTVENWLVFYLGRDVKVANKKKRHYHKKLNPCSHQHNEGKKKLPQKKLEIKTATKDKFKIQNKNQQVPRFFIPNDEIASHVSDEYLVSNIDQFIE